MDQKKMTKVAAAAMATGVLASAVPPLEALVAMFPDAPWSQQVYAANYTPYATETERFQNSPGGVGVKYKDIYGSGSRSLGATNINEQNAIFRKALEMPNHDQPNVKYHRNWIDLARGISVSRFPESTNYRSEHKNPYYCGFWINLDAPTADKKLMIPWKYSDLKQANSIKSAVAGIEDDFKGLMNPGSTEAPIYVGSGDSKKGPYESLKVKDASQPVLYATAGWNVVNKDKSYQAGTGVGVIFYDFKFQYLDRNNDMAPASALGTGDISTEADLIKAKNNQGVIYTPGVPESSFLSGSINNTLRETDQLQEVGSSKTTSVVNEVTNMNGYELSNTLGGETSLAVTISKKWPAIDAALTMTQAFNYSNTNTKSFQQTEGRSEGIEYTDSNTSVNSQKLPPHTRATIATDNLTSTVAFDYDYPVGISYKVKIVDGYLSTTSGYEAEGKPGLTRMKLDYQAQFGNDTYLDACDNLDGRMAHVYDDISEDVNLGTGLGTDLESDKAINWAQMMEQWAFGANVGSINYRWIDPSFGTIQDATYRLQKIRPMSVTGARITAQSKTTETELTMLPIYPLDSVKLGKDENSTRNLKPGETLDLNKIVVEGFNDKNVEYYGFNKANGSWVLTDQNGNLIDKDSDKRDIAEIIMEDGIPKLKMRSESGTVKLRYLINEKPLAKATSILTDNTYRYAENGDTKGQTVTVSAPQTNEGLGGRTAIISVTNSGVTLGDHGTAFTSLIDNVNLRHAIYQSVNKDTQTILSSEGSSESEINDILKGITNLNAGSYGITNLTGISKLTGLKTLDLSGNALESIPVSTFVSLTNLTSLNLQNNYIKSFTNGSFNGLTNLQTLDLTGNELTAITPGINVTALSNLQNLTLDNNKITNIPGNAFSSLKNLKTLNVRYNQADNMTVAANAFSDLSNVTSLSLRDAKLSTLTPEMFNGLAKVSILNVSFNQLTAIPTGVFKDMPELVTLWGGNNEKLQSIAPNAFTNLPKLSMLDLSMNSMQTLQPGTFVGLPGLKTLTLHNGRVAKIEAGVFDLPELTRLALYGNSLNYIAPDAFVKLPSLTQLELQYQRGNALLNFDAVHPLTTMTTLEIEQNYVDSWQKGIDRLATELGFSEYAKARDKVADALGYAKYSQNLQTVNAAKQISADLTKQGAASQTLTTKYNALTTAVRNNTSVADAATAFYAQVKTDLTLYAGNNGTAGQATAKLDATGRNNPAINTAQNAINTAVATGNYASTPQLVGQLNQAIAAYSDPLLQAAASEAARIPTANGIDQVAAVKTAKTNLQTSITNKNVGQLQTDMQALRTAINNAIDGQITQLTTGVPTTVVTSNPQIKAAVAALTSAKTKYEYTDLSTLFLNLENAVASYNVAVSFTTSGPVKIPGMDSATSTAVANAEAGLATAVNQNGADKLAEALVVYYTAVDTAITKVVNDSTGKIGNAGKQNPAVDAALQAITDAQTQHDYTELPTLVANLNTAVNKYAAPIMQAAVNSANAAKAPSIANVDGVANVPAVKTTQTALDKAIAAGQIDQLASLTTNLHKAINTAVTAKITAIKQGIGQGGANDNAIKQATAAINTAIGKATPDYSKLNTQFQALTTAVTNYKNGVISRANNALKHEKTQHAESNTLVGRTKANLQRAVNASAKNYDTIVTHTTALTTAHKKTTLKATDLTVYQSHHLNKYVSVKAKKGTKIKVVAGNKTLKSVTAPSNNRFNINVAGLKGKQALQIIANHPDSELVINKEVTAKHVVTTSPKPTLKVKIKGKSITGKATKGATLTIYKGGAKLKQAIAKNGNVKVTLKKRYAKNTKLTIKVQNDHDHGYGQKTFTGIRVK